MKIARRVAAVLTSLFVAGAAEATIFTYDFALKATTPNSTIPGTNQPFGFTSATPAGTFNARLSYEVLNNISTLLDFDLTIGDQTWSESPDQTFFRTLNPDGTLDQLLFRADSDLDETIPAQWSDIVEIAVNFAGSVTLWRAFESNCSVGADYVSGPCIQGTPDAGGITYVVSRNSVPEPNVALLLLLAGAGGALVMRRRADS